MKFRVRYTIPFSVDAEMREQVFEEEISSTDPKSARKKVYEKHHNANVISLEAISLL